MNSEKLDLKTFKKDREKYGPEYAQHHSLIWAEVDYLIWWKRDLLDLHKTLSLAYVENSGYETEKDQEWIGRLKKLKRLEQQQWKKEIMRDFFEREEKAFFYYQLYGPSFHKRISNILGVRPYLEIQGKQITAKNRIRAEVERVFEKSGPEKIDFWINKLGRSNCTGLNSDDCEIKWLELPLTGQYWKDNKPSHLVSPEELEIERLKLENGNLDYYIHKSPKETLVEILYDNYQIKKDDYYKAYEVFSRFEPLSSFQLVSKLLGEAATFNEDYQDKNFFKIVKDLQTGKLKTEETELLGYEPKIQVNIFKDSNSEKLEDRSEIKKQKEEVEEESEILSERGKLRFKM